MVAIGWFPFMCCGRVAFTTDWYDHFQRAAGTPDSCRLHVSVTQAILVLTGTAWPTLTGRRRTTASSRCPPPLTRRRARRKQAGTPMEATLQQVAAEVSDLRHRPRREPGDGYRVLAEQ